jgi:hypothetical protein
MTRSERLVQVKDALTEMVIYLAIAMDLPQWALKAIEKI